MGALDSIEEEPTAQPDGEHRGFVVEVRCGHRGNAVCFSDFQGDIVSAEWTGATLKRAIEGHMGVHRSCQKVMFAGREIDEALTIQQAVGCDPANLPQKKVSLYLKVDRNRFPQRLGPFSVSSVPADCFKAAPVNEPSGAYWDMDARLLRHYGVHARTDPLTGQISPSHPVTFERHLWEEKGVPSGTCDFAWSYPVENWQSVEVDAYELDNWDLSSDDCVRAAAALKSFLSVGGFMFFDSTGEVSGMTTIGQQTDDDDAGCLHFGEPRTWLPEWTAALAAQGRFQTCTIKAFREMGAQQCLWLKPNEIIEGADGNPLPSQPDVPHGGFVYLFHGDLFATGKADVALDRYFPLQTEAVVRRESVSDTPRGKLFRPFTLMDGDTIPTTAPAFRENSFVMTDYSPGGVSHGIGTPVNADGTPLSSRWQTPVSPPWPASWPPERP